MQNIFMVFEILLGLIVVVLVYMQPSKADALSGLIQGTTNDTFFAKNKSRTKEVILVRLTVMAMTLFAVNSILLNLIK